eukprot:m.306394 g.306394  ORF g.306394 m.306394 type:complete len:245 (+) comp41213_c0_seq1:413-1147(+)
MGGDSDLSCCGKFIKWALFVFNFILWAIGTAILGLGIATYIKYGNFLDELANKSWLSAPIIMMAVGSVMVVICFIGCCGAWKESQCMLYIFASFIIGVILVEIAAGVVGYLKRDELETTLQKELLNSLKEYNITPVAEAWDFAQKEFKCCGANTTYREWWTVTNFFPINHVPFSCCNPDNNTVCPTFGQYETTGQVTWYEPGCYQKIKQDIEDNYVPVLIALIVLACLEISGVVFGYWLACTVK